MRQSEISSSSFNRAKIKFGGRVDQKQHEGQKSWIIAAVFSRGLYNEASDMAERLRTQTPISATSHLPVPCFFILFQVKSESQVFLLGLASSKTHQTTPWDKSHNTYMKHIHPCTCLFLGTIKQSHSHSPAEMLLYFIIKYFITISFDSSSEMHDPC